MQMIFRIVTGIIMTIKMTIRKTIRTGIAGTTMTGRGIGRTITVQTRQRITIILLKIRETGGIIRQIIIKTTS